VTVRRREAVFTRGWGGEGPRGCGAEGLRG